MLTIYNGIMLVITNKGGIMIPLVIAEEEQNLTICKLVADQKTKRHLENLGILQGATIEIIAKNKGNIILKVKDGRLAIGEDLAQKIFIQGENKWKSI